MLSALHPTLALIKRENFRNNLKYLSERAKSAKIIPVVKANAYGHGAVEISKICVECGTSKLAVAHLNEGIELRKNGIDVEILVMGGIGEELLESFLEYDLTPTLININQLEKLSQISKDAKKSISVHLKFDTGMGRVGFPVEAAGFLTGELKKNKHLQLKGVYSHLACADEPENPLNRRQLDLYSDIVQIFHDAGHRDFEKHLLNSAGLLFFPEARYDAIRAGILLYGLSPGDFSPPPEIKPVMRLVTCLNQVKKIKKGTTVSYGATWKAKKDCFIGTVPLGYGDGFSRFFSGKEEVFEIRQKTFPVAGKVCMDLTMLDLGDFEAELREKVHVFGWGGKLKAEDHASRIGTITYEIVTSITERVPRVYI